MTKKRIVVLVIAAPRMTGLTTLLPLVLDSGKGETFREWIAASFGLKPLLVDDSREGGMGMVVRKDVAILFEDPRGKALMKELGIDFPKSARLDYERSAMEEAKRRLTDHLNPPEKGVLLIFPTSSRMLPEVEERFKKMGADKVLLYGVHLKGGKKKLEAIFDKRLGTRALMGGETQKFLDSFMSPEKYMSFRKKLRLRCRQLGAPVLELPNKEITIHDSARMLMEGLSAFLADKLK